jgi:CheY-like chemotaxis protein
MGARAVVLIVDDEFLVRSLAAKVAEEAGFNVVEADDADEGIRILESRPDIRLILTDIEMPGSMDGLELACAVSHRWPCIEVIVTSGKMRPHADELPDRGYFMPKPYSPSELTGLLQALC